MILDVALPLLNNICKNLPIQLMTDPLLFTYTRVNKKSWIYKFRVLGVSGYSGVTYRMAYAGLDIFTSSVMLNQLWPSLVVWIHKLATCFIIQT